MCLCVYVPSCTHVHIKRNPFEALSVCLCSVGIVSLVACLCTIILNFLSHVCFPHMTSCYYVRSHFGSRFGLLWPRVHLDALMRKQAGTVALRRLCAKCIFRTTTLDVKGQKSCSLHSHVRTTAMWPHIRSKANPCGRIYTLRGTRARQISPTVLGACLGDLGFGGFETLWVHLHASRHKASADSRAALGVWEGVGRR